MAITKLLRIKEAKGSAKSAHLKNNIFYISNPEKTGGGIYVGGNAGVAPEIVYQTFMWNKSNWNKLDYSQGYHYVLSFDPAYLIEEKLAYQIAEEFCKELLGDEFYYVFAVHNDQAHMHVHITFDSVSKTDGHKFHSPKGDWKKRIQPITDRLCEKYHLPTLQYNPERKKGRDYGSWREEKGEYYTWNDIVRDDIDDAILASETLEDLLQYLKEQSYEVRCKKYLSLKPQGRRKAVRTERLGGGYSKEELIQRIQDKKLCPEIEQCYKTYGDREQVRRIIYAKVDCTPGWKMTSLQKQFYRRWNNTYFIRKPGRMPQVWRYKQDILEVQKLGDALNYVIEHDIQELSDLHNRKEEIQKQITALQIQMKVFRTKLYKRRPNADIREYIKLSKDHREEPAEEVKLRLEELEYRIRKHGSLEKMLATYCNLETQIQEMKQVIRDVQREKKLVDGILELWEGYEEPNIYPECYKKVTANELELQEKECEKNNGTAAVRYHESDLEQR